MQTSVLVVTALLIIAIVGLRANYVLNRRIALKLGLDNPGFGATLTDGIGSMMATSQPGQTSAPASTGSPTGSSTGSSSLPGSESPTSGGAATSGFEGLDFMSHAHKMDARKPRSSAPSPVKKIEALMMENDHAQRKLRSKLIGQ